MAAALDAPPRDRKHDFATTASTVGLATDHVRRDVAIRLPKRVGALAPPGECPKTRTNADSVAAAVASILSFSMSRELTMGSRPCQVTPRNVARALAAVPN